ncbi:MAG: hypothetical protein SPL13_03990, partial [Clostridia bacterium]|nr:hypothetical protein [Clostridia bacterium]
GTNWYYNNHLESWEHTLYGMHALYNVTDQFGNRLNSEEAISASAAQHGFGTNVLAFKRAVLCGDVIRKYIEHTCKLFYDEGITRGKIFSHTLGYASNWPMPEAGTGQELKYDTFTVPLSVAINDYCTPSWSLTKDSAYNLNYIKQALARFAPGFNAFANSEGYMDSYTGGGYASQQAYVESFLGGNARMITFFGYDMDDVYPKDGTNPYNAIVSSWLNGTLLPGYSFNNRPSVG